MWLIGTYKDIHNNTITVKIRNEKNGDNIELGGALVKFAAEDAVTIDCDRDDYFTHIIKKSATIRLVTRIYLGDYLWAANQKSVIVNILRNGKCVFAGYVTPNTYTQDYVEEWTTLDINCRDLLSTLEDTNLVDKDKYDAFKQNAQTISLKAYLELFGILNANLNLDNYPQPMFKSNFIWITDGYIYKDGVFYAKLIEVEQVTVDGQVKNIATGNYKLGKVLEPNWILDETKTTTYNGLKYNLEFAYLDIDGNGIYETRTNVSRRAAEPIFDQVYRDVVTYGDVIEQIHLEEYTVTTNVTRTYVVDYGIHKAGDVEYLHGMEHCIFELRDEPNVSVLKRYVWVYYGNEWHKTNFYEDIDIPEKPTEPNPDIPDPNPNKDYLCFTSTGDSTIKMEQVGTPNKSDYKVIKYKLNNGQWQKWDLSTISLSDGDKMYLKSDDEVPVSEYRIYKKFVMTGSIAASGNIMSLRNFSDTLTQNIFDSLFAGCTALTAAPKLPVTTLDEHCYSAMFQGCTSLTVAPDLPATTMANWCYAIMFDGCTSLTTAPALPATTLARSCYEYMFQGCTSLTTAPDLPATVEADFCYNCMFRNCTKLNYVRAMLTTVDSDPILEWLSNVSAKGTFVKNQNADWSNTPARIPTGWIVKTDPYQTKEYLCFTSSGNSTVAMTQKGTPNTSAGKVIQYKLNDGQWQAWDLSTISLTDGDKMYVKSDDEIPMSENISSKTFVMTGSIAASGNIMSLLNFSTTLTTFAFSGLFSGCTSLTTAPNLPAITMQLDCYNNMFYGCTSLVNAPVLPASTLAVACYSYMFENCTSLIQAPELPAKVLKERCYEHMFEECRSLEHAPVLAVNRLEYNCYDSMFYYCKKLNYVKALFTTKPSSDYTYNWLTGVSSTGTFIKSKNASWYVTGTHGVPTGWTVQSE